MIIIPYVAPMYDSPDTLNLALQSIKRYFQGDFEVRIVGLYPEGIDDDGRFVWMDVKERGESQHTDMVRRITRALTEKDKEFILWHDDMFAVNEVSADEIRQPRAITSSILSSQDSDNYYLRDMHYTLEELRKAGITYMFNYTIHCPVMYQVDRFMKMVMQYDLENVPLDFEMLYFNLYCREPQVLKDDNNDWRLMMDDLHKPPLDRPRFIGLNNRFNNKDYLRELEERILKQ